MSSMWMLDVRAKEAAGARADDDELETFAIYVRPPGAGDGGGGEVGDGAVATDSGTMSIASASDAATASASDVASSSAQAASTDPSNASIVSTSSLAALKASATVFATAPNTPELAQASVAPPATTKDATEAAIAGSSVATSAPLAESVNAPTADAKTVAVMSAPSGLRMLGESEATESADAALAGGAAVAAGGASASASGGVLAGSAAAAGNAAVAGQGLIAGTGSGGQGRSGTGNGSGEGDGAGGPPGAVLTFGPRPEYPELSVRRGEEGQVLCTIHIDAAGHVTGVDVLRSSGHPRLDLAAQEALAKWRFLPARKDGVAVPCRVPHAVTFKLE